MISSIVLRKGFATLVLALPVLVLQGCLATQDWVREQLTPTESRVGTLEGQLQQLSTRLSATENRLSSAEGRISQVDARVDQVSVKLDEVSNIRWLTSVWSASSCWISKMGPFMPPTPRC
jgi:septal ring factor EnvC (AmiA/AmiB activator)